MNKKIKIGLINVNNLEFELLEDGQKGDTFSLKQLDENKINFEKIFKQINDRTDKYYNEKLKEELKKQEKQLKDDFLSSKEYKSLENKIIKLEYELKLEKEKSKKEYDKLIENEYEKYEKMLELELKKQEVSIGDLYNRKINDLENQLKLKNDEYNSKLKEKDFEYNKKIDEIERKRIDNIKLIGENLENWINNEYNNSFGVHDDCLLEKTTKSIDGTKADFLFKVIDTKDDDVLGSVTIEAKSQHSVSNTLTKNEQFYSKLEKDRKNNNSEFSLLITELEPNDSFYIKKVNDEKYKNMFVVRPSYFLVFLSIIRYIFLKKKSIKIKEINFKDKKEIEENFNKMKDEILDNSVKNIDANLLNILKSSDAIQKEIDKINELANMALNKHLNTIRNKIKGFKINTVIKKIENLNENHNNEN